MKKYEKVKVIAKNSPKGSFAAGCGENTRSHWCGTCAISSNK